jgi:hypothetical protein
MSCSASMGRYAYHRTKLITGATKINGFLVEPNSPAISVENVPLSSIRVPPLARALELREILAQRLAGERNPVERIRGGMKGSK